MVAVCAQRRQVAARRGALVRATSLRQGHHQGEAHVYSQVSAASAILAFSQLLPRWHYCRTGFDSHGNISVSFKFIDN